MGGLVQMILPFNWGDSCVPCWFSGGGYLPNLPKNIGYQSGRCPGVKPTPRLQRSTAWPAMDDRNTLGWATVFSTSTWVKYRKHYITVESPDRFQHILFLETCEKVNLMKKQKSTNMGHHFGDAIMRDHLIQPAMYFMGPISSWITAVIGQIFWRSPAMYGWFQK